MTSEARLSGRSDGAAPTTVAYYCTPGEDLVTAVFAGSLIVGGLTDAWAHTNIIDTIESFFTPWHGLMYGGFAATAIWTVWLAFRRRRTVTRWWRDGWPVGYSLGAVGLVGFLVAGLLDMAWHTVFGIEVSLDATFSPSHLLLAFSAILLVTSPVRSWWATGQGGMRAVAGVSSLALGTVALSLLLTPYSAFASTAPTREYDHASSSLSSLDATLGMATYLVTTVLLMVPLLLAQRRRPTPGTATAIVAVVSLFTCIMFNLPGIQTAGAVGAIAGALVTDLGLMRLDAKRGRGAVLRLPIAGGLFATLVWTGQLLGMHLAAGLRWPPELVTGSVVFGAVIGIVLGLLAQTPSRTTVSPDAGTASQPHDQRTWPKS